MNTTEATKCAVKQGDDIVFALERKEFRIRDTQPPELRFFVRWARYLYGGDLCCGEARQSNSYSLSSVDALNAVGAILIST